MHAWTALLLCLTCPITGTAQGTAVSPDGDVTADETAELADEDELAAAVVVTASRIPEGARDAVVATDVVTREEIETSGARDAAELLEERSGLQLNRSFRGTELWLRGLDASYVLFLLDGERIPGRIGGAIDLSRYGVEGIERIEVVRGPSSAIYGSEAIGGVVNIVPRESNRDFEADVLGSYGLGNLVDFTGRVAGRPDRHLRFNVNAGLHYADAFRREETEGTTGSSRLQWSAGGSLEWRPDGTHRGRAIVDYTQLALEGVDEGTAGAIFDRTQVQEQLFTSLEHRITGRAGLMLRTRLTYSQFREQYLLDQRGGSRLDRYEDNAEHLAQLSSILSVRPHDAHTLTFGFEQLYQELRSERLARTGQRGRTAFFAQDEWLVFEDGPMNLRVVPGLRLDLDSQFGDQLSPKLAVRFDPARELILRASYGRGFRAPSFQQLFLRFENPSVGYIVSGNPEVGAESSHGVDVGFEWEPVRELSFAAAFFRNDLEDMIAVVTVDDPSQRGALLSYANIATAWTMGLESSARLRVEDFLTVTAGYTLTETWDGQNERHLEGRARHRFTLSARFSYEPWDLDVVGRAALLVDRIHYVDVDGDGTDDELYGEPIAQIDLRVAKRFTRHFELFVGIDNLLDAGDAFTVLRPLTVYGGARGRH